MPETSYIYLTLFGDFDPNEIAPLIKLNPSESYRKHSRSEEYRLPRVSRLIYGLLESSDECPDIYQLSEQLVDLLEPHTAEFADVTNRYEIDCCCSICLWISLDPAVSTPAIGFSRRVTRFLASVNASIDVDSYRDSNGDEEPTKKANKSEQATPRKPSIKFQLDPGAPVL
jgi:hypothetical protein